MNLTEEQFREMIERAKDAGACSGDIGVIESLTAEEFLAHDDLPDWLYWYARYVIGGRWPEAEPIIRQRAGYAYHYALDVIKGRWPEAEPTIRQDEFFAKCYEYTIIKGPWPEESK